MKKQVELLRVTNPHKEGESFLVSRRMLDEQGAWSSLEKIKELHLNRFDLERNIELAVDHKALLSELLRDWTELQFQLQDIWGFKRDATRHKWWYLPNCSCSKIDNNWRYPSEEYVMSLECKIHGE